ncbi:iron-containing alcohol dehydrogenase [Dongia soli]|uniref:Iron-containing alcohol dehydrogenase n=1 Tax=Dongia soli TaxID=600628 RepID=A0ABU5EBU0_9PROT|nr:iron-containing alcohol dehydrogenase [Dongia soli]MDY0883816.1 iron-containing alcohol dehydrogenase [Dongia soli]
MSNDAAALRGNWNYPTSVKFGCGRIVELPDHCKALGIKRPLLVTDPGLAGLPMIKDAIARNEAAGLPTGLFSDVQPNPIGKNVEEGVKVYKAGKHDGVIAWGGGSGLDAAKAVAFMAGQTRPLWDFEDIGDWWTRADANAIAPIIAVPTTSGTGSEVGRASVITDEVNHVKKIIFHPKMLPSIVIDDPELTVGLPPHITAATGMDALSHNLEAFCAPGYHPLADGIALEGMRLIKEWLPVAVKDGKNLVARAQMMAASSMGATAFQKGLGGMHAISHPLGALYHTHHGLTNAVVMPYVLEFNRKVIDEKLTALARYLNLPNPSFQAVQKWVLDLRQEIGIPHTLRDIKVDDKQVDKVAEMAAVDPSAGGNPIKVGAAELRQIFVAALDGKLSA